MELKMRDTDYEERAKMGSLMVFSPPTSSQPCPHDFNPPHATNTVLSHPQLAIQLSKYLS